MHANIEINVICIESSSCSLKLASQTLKILTLIIYVTNKVLLKIKTSHISSNLKSLRTTYFNYYVLNSSSSNYL